MHEMWFICQVQLNGFKDLILFSSMLMKYLTFTAVPDESDTPCFLLAPIGLATEELSG